MYQLLSGIALEAFKKGDHVKAAQVAVVIEHFWDASQTTKDIRKNSPATYKSIDSAMDVFLGSLERPKSDRSSYTDPEVAYNDYIGKLQLKPLAVVLREAAKAQGTDSAIRLFRSLRTEGFPGIIATEDDLNDVGYALLSKGDKEGAIKILELNVDMYPTSANVYDSLGEAYAAIGQKDHAIENYRKALTIDPNLATSVKALKQLQSN
jgi:tetratricopeptide (TPR) repeat protein